MAQYNLGRCFPVAKGNWIAGTAYVMLDIVYNPADGYSYICKKDNMDAPVTNTQYWVKFASKGADGKNGVDGVDGARGPQGPQGPKGDPGKNGVSPNDVIKIVEQAGYYKTWFGTQDEYDQLGKHDPLTIYNIVEKI